MSKRRQFTTGVAAVAVAVATGYFGGGLLTAQAAEPAVSSPVATEAGTLAASPPRASVSNAGPSSIPVAGVPAKSLDPFIELGNGKTAGNWRMDTPAAERPDYFPVSMGNGEIGYVRLADTIEGQVVPVDGSADVAKIYDDTIRRLAAAGMTPSANGELSAPVYAKDGTTVIGEHLVVSSPTIRPGG